MREPVEVRRQRILAAVESRGSARVSDLAAELEVSVVTVRRDVEELAQEGRLRRGHGVVRSTLAARDIPAPRPPDGDTVAVVVPERHHYLYESLHGARSVLEASGKRIALHIAPQVAGAERPWSSARWRTAPPVCCSPRAGAPSPTRRPTTPGSPPSRCPRC